MTIRQPKQESYSTKVLDHLGLVAGMCEELKISELIDAIWLFMNSSNYWNPPNVGVNATYERGY